MGAGDPSTRHRQRPVCYTENDCPTSRNSQKGVLQMPLYWQERIFTSGQILLCFVCLFYTTSFSSTQWVCRTYNVTRNLLHGGSHPSRGARVSQHALRNYGLWKACDMNGQCDRIWTKVENINIIVVGLTQGLATAAFIGYGLCVLLELVSQIRVIGSLLAVNRATEMLLGSSAVLHFLTMLIFTGEVKNRARRVPDSEDSACWAFRLMAVSGVAAVLVVVVMGLFRHVPRWRRPKRHWKLPGHLVKFQRPQAASTSSNSP